MHGIHGWRQSRPSYKVQGYRGIGVQGYRGTGAQGYMGTWVHGYRDIGIHGYRGIEVHGYIGTWVQGYKGYRGIWDIIIIIIIVVVVVVVYRHWGRIQEDVIAVITRAVLQGLYYLFRELSILHRYMLYNSTIQYSINYANNTVEA